MKNYLLILLLSLVTTTATAQTAGILEITDVFNVSGHGTVIVGSLTQGNLTIGDEVDLVKPDDTVAGKITITGIEQFRRSIQTADQIGEQYGFRVNADANTQPAQHGDRLIRRNNPANQNFVLAGTEGFSISGKGTLLTGAIRSGIINTGDRVDVIGFNYDPRTTIVTEIELGQQVVPSADAGEFVGLVIRGINKQDVGRGTVLATPGTIEQTNVIKVQVTFQEDISIPNETLYLFGTYVLITDMRVQILHVGSPQVMSAGTQRELVLASDRPIIVKLGETVYLRKGGRRVAEGTVTEIGIP